MLCPSVYTSATTVSDQTIWRHVSDMQPSLRSSRYQKCLWLIRAKPTVRRRRHASAIKDLSRPYRERNRTSHLGFNEHYDSNDGD